MAIEYLSDILLPRDPQNPLEAATKQYVDNNGGGGGGGGGGEYLPLTGGVLTGDVRLDGPMGEQRGIDLLTGGNGRWRLAKTGDAEDDGNDGAGSNLILSMYNNAGDWVANAIFVERLTALVYVADQIVLGAGPYAPMHATTKQYVDDSASSEAADAVAAHTSEPDPHPQYVTGPEASDALATKEDAGVAAGLVSAHAAAADPHTGYQKETEKASANGYASLDASTKVPIAQVPTGTSGTTVALGNHLHTGVYDPAGTAAARTPKITVGTTAPGSPAVNDIWVDTS